MYKASSTESNHFRVHKNSNNKTKGVIVTGQLGDVMKESAKIAFTYAKNFLTKVDAGNKFFNSVIAIIVSLFFHSY